MPSGSTELLWLFIPETTNGVLVGSSEVVLEATVVVLAGSGMQPGDSMTVLEDFGGVLVRDTGWGLDWDTCDLLRPRLGTGGIDFEPFGPMMTNECWG